MTTMPAAPPIADQPAPDRARPWYRRRAFLTTAVVVAVLVITVVTDLPTHATHASDVTNAKQVTSEIATDAAPCNLGMTEALLFYRDVSTGHITAAHRAQIPALIRDDLDACSFTNQSLVDLGSIDVPGNATGRALNAVAYAVLTWCDPAALSTIGEITNLIEKQPTASGERTLVADEKLLTKDRAAEQRSIVHLEATTGSTHVTPIPLVVAP